MALAGNHQRAKGLLAPALDRCLHPRDAGRRGIGIGCGIVGQGLEIACHTQRARQIAKATKAQKGLWICCG